ncbi:MAG: IclR family transcriptional regulator [Ramlibacter sp.]|nr:IclR family transcriptional regulator [Ramlibacter sp.]
MQNQRKSTPPVASVSGTAGTKEDRHFVTALARGLDVLSVFRPLDRVLGNQELARRSGLPKSTVSRLTYTLTKLGYLEPAPDGCGGAGYRLGSRVLALGSTLLQRLDVRALARPLMQELADQSRTMVALGTPDRKSMIYIETCRSQATVTLRLNVGSRIPMATTAMGRAYLAICSEGERTALMERFRDGDPLRWPLVEQGILGALETHGRHGCCTSFTEWQSDVNAVAVAFRVAGQPPLAISCGGLACSSATDYLMDTVRPRMLRLVERLVRLGSSAPDAPVQPARAASMSALSDSGLSRGA